MDTDQARTHESSHVGVGIAAHDPVQWRAAWTVEKFWTPEPVSSGDDLRRLTVGGLEPYEVLDHVGNLLMYGGASILWEALVGAAPTYFNNANAYIGVGGSTNSTNAEAATQTDLQGASTTRKAMDTSYPTHSDGTTSGNATVVFRSVFGTSDANHAWSEWGVFNASAAGRMLNRKVQDLGVKTSAASWTFTVSLSLA